MRGDTLARPGGRRNRAIALRERRRWCDDAPDMRVFLRLVVASACCVAAAQPAGAQEGTASWPLEAVNRPLTLAAGMVEIGGDSLIVGVSGGEADPGQPILLAPELRYGVSGQLQIGVTHTNHFPFFPPAGVCVSGEEKGCAKVYNTVGAELEYALSSGGSAELSARAGATVGRFDPDFALGATAGLEARLRSGSIAVVIDPSVYIGIIERDTFPIGMAGDSHPDWLFLPVRLQLQATSQAMIYAMSGLNTPLKDMGDFYQIPAGLGASYAASNRMDIGLEFQVANAAGKDLGLVEKLDERYLIARIAFRL
jgi:hypothetical protein